MASRSNTTFQKRQKEQARIEKQKDKASRRAIRKANKGSEEPGLETFSAEEAPAAPPPDHADKA